MALKSRKNKNHATSPSVYRVITAEKPLSVAAESYRRIKVALEFSEVDHKIQVIQLCSSVKGEGKTLTALNIAATYVEDGEKVLVVDLDLRRPKVHRSIKVLNREGISDLLAGNITIDQAIKHTEGYYDVLNSGTKSPYPSSLIASEAMAKLFDDLRKRYDKIIVDCPPILAVSDAVVIHRLCDTCVFLVNQKTTEKGAAKEAISILKQNNVNIGGIILGNVTKDSNNYYNSKYKYYYHDYYQSYESGNTSSASNEHKN